MNRKWSISPRIFMLASSEAVAETMGISTAGVNSRLSRARKMLRDLLEQQKGNER